MSRLLPNVGFAGQFDTQLPNLSENSNQSYFNSQAPVAQELAHRGVFKLSRLRVTSFAKMMKEYTPQIEYSGFSEILHFG